MRTGYGLRATNRAVVIVSFFCGLICTALITGCAAVKHVAVSFFYKYAPLPAQCVTYNIPYAGNSNPRQRLNFFRPPQGNHWPVLIFVPGGGWTSGGKDLTFGGDDVYGNIGRFYASRGIGVAVISYRLQPHVTWREQVSDVAQAVSWTHSNVGQFGGDTNRIFLFGHSAGAELAAYVALNPAPLEGVGLANTSVTGVIAVSGAGYDLEDNETYALGQDPAYYKVRFSDNHANGDWKKSASAVTYVKADAPPFLVLYASGESKGLKRQSEGLLHTLRIHHVACWRVIVPGQSHSRIVLTLSRPDKTAAPAVLNFIYHTGRR